MSVERRSPWTILLIVLAPLVLLFGPLIRGEAPGAFDQIRQMAPWNGPAPAQAWDVLQADSVLQFYPWRDLVLKSWAEGRVPWWNPHQLCGSPLLANSQSGALYPPHILLGVAHVPTPIALVLLAWFHLAWAGVGLCLLARELGARPEASAAAAISFSLGSFMVSWTALPSVISTVAWIPWLWLFAIRSVGGAQRSDFARLTLACAMMLLAGHLQFAAYGALSAGLIVACRGAQIRQWRTLGWAMLALALGPILAAPQLVPVLAAGRTSHRASTPSEDGYQAAMQAAIRPDELAARLVWPFTQGVPTERVASNLAIAKFRPAIERPGANFAESAVTIGPIALVGLIGLAFTIRSQSRTWPLAIGGLFGLLVALGTPVNRWLVFGIPGWSATGSPGRAIVLFLLGACVLSAVGLEFGTGSDRQQRDRKTVVALLAVIIGLLGTVLRGGVGPATGDLAAALREPSVWENIALIAPVVIAGIAVTLIDRVRFLLPVAAVGLAWLFALPVWRAGTPLALVTPPGPSSSNERIALVNRSWSLFEPARAVAPPNTATHLDLFDVAGYDSLIDRRTVEMLKRLNGGAEPAPPANGNMMLLKSGRAPAELAEAGVTYLVSPVPQPELGAPAGEWNGDSVYRLSSPGIVSTPQGGATDVVQNTSGLKATVLGPGPATVRVLNLGSWRGFVDGKEVEVQGEGWVQLPVGEGQHQIELRWTYQPNQWLWVWISALFWPTVFWVACRKPLIKGSAQAAELAEPALEEAIS